MKRTATIDMIDAATKNKRKKKEIPILISHAGYYLGLFVVVGNDGLEKAFVRCVYAENSQDAKEKITKECVQKCPFPSVSIHGEVTFLDSDHALSLQSLEDKTTDWYAMLLDMKKH